MAKTLNNFCVLVSLLVLYKFISGCVLSKKGFVFEGLWRGPDNSLKTSYGVDLSNRLKLFWDLKQASLKWITKSCHWFARFNNTTLASLYVMISLYFSKFYLTILFSVCSVLSAEKLNELLAQNWAVFARQQYFDRNKEISILMAGKNGEL